MWDRLKNLNTESLRCSFTWDLYCGGVWSPQQSKAKSLLKESRVEVKRSCSLLKMIHCQLAIETTYIQIIPTRQRNNNFLSQFKSLHNHIKDPLRYSGRKLTSFFVTNIPLRTKLSVRKLTKHITVAIRSEKTKNKK